MVAAAPTPEDLAELDEFPLDDDLSFESVLQQQTEIKTTVLEKYRHLAVQATQKVNYIHVVSGKISIEERILTAGDALLFAEDTLIKALQDSQLIWFDLPEI